MALHVLICIAFLMLLFSASSEVNTTSETYTLLNTTNLAKPGCDSKCGDLIVPYPFGIGLNSNCSIDPGFDVYCNTSSNPPRLSFQETDDLSIKLISDSTLWISNGVSQRCYYPNGKWENDTTITWTIADWFTISQVNKFTVIGCNDYAWMNSSTKSGIIVSTGCMVFCSKPKDALRGRCSGNGCCQSSIPKAITSYKTHLDELIGSKDDNSTRSFNPCTYAFVGKKTKFKFRGAKDLNDPSFKKRIEATVPLVFDWAVGNLSCHEANKTNSLACESNTKCVNSKREIGGYRCICKKGYRGNPYLYPGCQDIDECENKKKHPCYGICVNTQGNYTCKCHLGHYGDARTPDGCRKKPFAVLPFSIGMGLGLLAMLIGLPVLYFSFKKRKLVKQRENFFDQNGGRLLKEKLKSLGGEDSMKIFGVEELKKATGDYAKDKILGKGGQGVVYKGILTDKRVVAIKKSQKPDQEQREQFTNEIAILLQIKHQNVVKLLGCCLETEVPLLVYEFVSNDTLSHHIHNKTSGKRRLSWDDRLRIACETAGALAYLHSAASMPIIHRDVKTSNILLDENYTSKFADFGISRVIPLGHAQVTTLIRGTRGYLDPEYLFSGKLTEKSDVYSFGVVLAELLTGEKPLGVKSSLEEENLSTYFVKAIKENRLLEILEPQVEKEVTNDIVEAIGELTYRCLNLACKDRPSMTDVFVELETLRKKGKHPQTSQDNYSEMSSIMIESGQIVPVTTNIDTFGEEGSSSSQMKDMMHQLQNPR